MSATYPKPATPLPWDIGTNPSDYDHHYLVRAANAFPHLVAALEMASAFIWHWSDDDERLETINRALAIARGEAAP